MSSSSILLAVISRLNSQLLLTGIVKKTYGIAVKGDRVKDKADYIVYIGDGQAVPVTNFDNWIGSSFWIRNGQTGITKASDTINYKSCATLQDFTFPLRLVSVVQRSELPCDIDGAVDSIAQEIIKKLSGDIKSSEVGFGAQNIEVDPRGYIDNLPGLTLPYEYAVVVIDFSIRIRIDSDCIPEFCEGLVIPPIGCDDGIIQINGGNFGTVVSGATINILVQYENGNQVGSKVGDIWVIPDAPECEDATAVLKNTEGNTLSTTSIPSGDSQDIIAPDGDIELNGVSVGSVISGGTTNIPVRYVNGTPVGSLNAGVWEIPDPAKDLVTRVQFDAGATLDYTITIDSDTAGTYTAVAFSGGMASATYEKNGGAVTLPFTLVATDTLRIFPNSVGVIKLSGTYP